VPGVEGLEARALLATGTGAFQAPDLSDLIREAFNGVNTAPAAINREVQALGAQLITGPLADLKAGTVDGDGFIQEVSTLVTSYETTIDQQLSARFPTVSKMMTLQGERILADLSSLNQQATVGLITSDQLATDATAAIGNLTTGSLKALGTPFGAYVDRTRTFESDLNTLAGTLSSTATTPLTLAQVDTTLDAEAEAYRADMSGSLVLHPAIDQMVVTAVTDLEDQVDTIAQNNPSDAQTEIQNAIAAFDAAVLDTTGIFGPRGAVGRFFVGG
jgi:hypothetical protein